MIFCDRECSLCNNQGCDLLDDHLGPHRCSSCQDEIVDRPGRQFG